MTTKINVPEIKRVLAHIEENTLRLQMLAYGFTKDSYYTEHPSCAHLFAEPFAECGTKACFAGWTRILNTPEEDRYLLFYNGTLLNGTTYATARNILGFSDEIAQFVFGVTGVTEDNDYTNHETSIEQLATLKKRINSVFEWNGIEDRV